MKTCAQIAVLTLLNIFTLTILTSTAPLDARIHVPGDAPDLQAALEMADNGEHIILASGVHPVPAGGFLWNRNRGWSLHIEGAPGGAVLDGQGLHPIFRQRFEDFVSGGLMFRNITFRNGFSDTDGIAGGLTLHMARATMINCHFDNNETVSTTRGGGAILAENRATVHLVNTRLTNNRAKVRGGAIELVTESNAVIFNSEFSGNRVDLPLHDPFAAGGAIYSHWGRIRIANSSFENNRAGYAGGAIYFSKDWEEEDPPWRFFNAELYATNTRFVDNAASPFIALLSSPASSGGAIHTENQTLINLFNSRFLRNEAENGGAVTAFRSTVNVDETVFRHNFASGNGAGNGFGGTLYATSDDVHDATTENGTINRPSAEITLRRSLIEGREAGRSARNGGCLNINGDTHRAYGRNGVTPMDDPTFNRARLVISDSVFFNCDVESEAGVQVSGTGGAMELVHVDLDLRDSMIMNSDATGNGGTAGAARLVADTSSQIHGTTFAYNGATQMAGALVFTGGSLNIDNSQFFGNGIFVKISSPVEERPPAIPAVDSQALFFSPGIHDFGAADNPAQGTVSHSIFIANGGAVIVEDDRADGPINDLIYDSNTFFGSTHVFSNPLVGPQSVSDLNTLTIIRDPLVGDTVKSNGVNAELGLEPDLATVFAIPPHRLPASASTDGTPTEAYLAFAWSGPGPATLDGLAESARAGVQSVGPGIHTLDVGTLSAMREVEDLPPIWLRARSEYIGLRPYMPTDYIGIFWETDAVDSCAIPSRYSGCATDDHYFNVHATEMAYLVLFSPRGGAVDKVLFVGDPDDAPPDLFVFHNDLESSDLTEWSRHVIQP